MPFAAGVAVSFVALLHLWFLVLEMFLWTTPMGLRTFGLAPDFARATRALAANQGLYNGFLATGLLWGLARREAGFETQVFFLVCVLVAGLFGAITASRRILWVQALPAAVALVLVLAARG